MSVKLARRLVEPDHLTGPAWVDTYGPLVADLCAAADFAPDPQQELLLDRIFAIRADGLPASFSAAVICCRQNLKTGLFKQAALGWVYVTEQQLIVWSAHELPTAAEAQRDLVGLIEGTPALRKRLKRSSNEGIYEANGQQRIEFESGQRIVFRARTLTGGRGLTGDKTILDEAFALQPSHVGSLLPTMMTRPEAQVLYGSSAGKADSEVLRDVRDRGRAGASPRMTYAEWLAPRKPCANPRCKHPKDHSEPGCALDREDLRVAGNPTLSTGRITLERIEDMRQELTPEEFARECLGWWDEVASTSSRLISADAWEQTAVDVAPEGIRSLAIVFDRDGSRQAVAGAVKHDDGVHVELVGGHSGSAELGTQSLVAWLTSDPDRPERWRSLAMISIAGGGEAPTLAEALVTAGVPRQMLHVMSTPQVFAANAMTLDAVRDRTLSHPRAADDTDALDASVAVSDQKVRAGGWSWTPTMPSGDEMPIEAVSMALWTARTTKRRPIGDRRQDTRGRAAGRRRSAGRGAGHAHGSR